jgi:hypothetical protein
VKHYKKRLLLTVALIPVLDLNAQTVYPDIVVKYPTKGNLVKYFPYSTVLVIDNRVDTTRIYTHETGTYPPRHVNFNEPAAVVIKKYIDSSVRDSRKGPGELLINIEQLTIPNIHHIELRVPFRRTRHKWLVRKSRRGENIVVSHPRGSVQLMATAWYKNEQGNYNKLLTVKKEASHTNYQFDKYMMRWLLDDWIKTIAVTNSDSTGTEMNIPFEQINVNVRNRWKNYAVIKENSAVPGICYAFNDFTNNRITPAAIQLALNVRDSLYRITSGNDSLIRGKPHWGVYDGASWYIHLTDSAYCKLTRQGDTYGFYIPRNLPDMYAMLSIQENQMNSSASSSPTLTGSNGGGLLIGFAALLVTGAINDGITNNANRKLEKKLTAEGLKHNYRYCTLNMDNGDIYYNEK